MPNVLTGGLGTDGVPAMREHDVRPQLGRGHVGFAEERDGAAHRILIEHDALAGALEHIVEQGCCALRLGLLAGYGEGVAPQRDARIESVLDEMQEAVRLAGDGHGIDALRQRELYPDDL